MTCSHDLTLHEVPKSRTEDKGSQYQVYFRGELLLTSRDPQLDACRALVARGLAGEAYFWRAGKTAPDMRIKDIKKASRFRTVESEFKAPYFLKHTSNPFADFKHAA